MNKNGIITIDVKFGKNNGQEALDVPDFILAFGGLSLIFQGRSGRRRSRSPREIWKKKFHLTLMTLFNNQGN